MKKWSSTYKVKHFWRFWQKYTKKGPQKHNNNVHNLCVSHLAGKVFIQEEKHPFGDGHTRSKGSNLEQRIIKAGKYPRNREEEGDWPKGKAREVIPELIFETGTGGFFELGLLEALQNLMINFHLKPPLPTGTWGRFWCSATATLRIFHSTFFLPTSLGKINNDCLIIIIIEHCLMGCD